MGGIDGYRPDAVYLPQCMSHSKTFEEGSLVFNIFGRMVLNLLFLTSIPQVKKPKWSGSQSVNVANEW